MCRHLTWVRQERKLPVVLNKEEVLQLLEAAPGVKYKAALSVTYGAGLRVSEVTNLKVTDIESKRMLLRIEQGKGKKDRYAMLSPRLLAILRDYWWVARPTIWLFPGRDPLIPITTRQLHRVVRDTAEAAGAAAPQLAPPLQPPHTATSEDTILPQDLDHPCPHCGCHMLIIDTFEAGCRPRHRPSAPASSIGINSS